MILRIKDLPISVKSLVAPVAGALISVAIVVVAVVANNAAVQLAREADQAEKLVAAVTGARLQFVQGHAALFRTVSWRASNVEARLVATALKEAMDSIRRANEALRNLPVSAVRDQAKVDALAKLMAEYESAARQTGDIVQDDAFTATMMMTDAHERSLKAAAAFESFVGEIDAASAALRARASSALQDGVRLIMLVAAAGIILALGLALLLARLISRPVVGLTGTVAKLADGDLGVEIPAADRADEIGAMARAVIVLKQNSVEMRRLQGEQKAAEVRAAEERKQEMRRLADGFEAAVGGIVSAVSAASGKLESAAGMLAKTAEITQELSGMVATASEQASVNVQSVASATEEMTSSVGEISRQVNESSRIAGEAVKQAERTDGRIAQLSQAASRIGDVVKLITAIAEQTNLLALNATIEAARAGEAGRGFAVVASEVKALAAQTAKATDEIGVQIAGMQQATSESVAAIKEIGATIDRISDIAATIAAAVEEQGAATSEIARNVHQAALGTAQVASNIMDVNRGATETGTASAQVLTSAQSLAAESGHLQDEVGKFLATVRAA